MTRRGGALLVLLAAGLWGTTGTARALGVPDVAPTSVGAWRIVLGGAVLFAIALGTRTLPTGTGSRRRTMLLVIGGAAVAAYQLAFFTAVASTGVAVGTVVTIGSAPILAGAISRASGGPPLTRRWAGATAGAIAGCALLVLAGGTTGVKPAGVGLGLLAGLSYAVYAVSASRLIRGGQPERGVMGAIFGIGALALLPLALASDSSWVLTVPGLLTAGWLAAGTTVVAYLLYGRGLRLVPISVSATIGLAEPAVATLLGLGILGERLDALAIVGLGALAISLGIEVLGEPERRDPIVAT